MASCLGFSSLLVSFDGANVELFGQDDEPGQQSSGSKTFTRLLSNLVKVLLWTTLNSFAALQDLHPAEYASWMLSLWHTLQVVRFAGTTGQSVPYWHLQWSAWSRMCKANRPATKHRCLAHFVTRGPFRAGACYIQHSSIICPNRVFDQCEQKLRICLGPAESHD